MTKDIAEPMVDPVVYQFVKPNVDVLNGLRPDAPYTHS